VTVIAFRDGVLCADRLVTTQQAEGRCGMVRKIAIGPGGMGGCAGPLSYMVEFSAWVEAGADAGEFPAMGDKEWEAILIRPDGRVVFFDNCGNMGAEVTGEFHAIGCAGVPALVAMAGGLTARQAAEACCKIVTACGGAIDTYLLSDVPGYTGLKLAR
jgi:hypothetical protein